MKNGKCVECAKEKRCERAKIVEGCRLYSPRYEHLECAICGRSDVVHRHHIFPGPLRSKSDKYGLVIDLCLCHHTEGRDAVHRSRDAADTIKQIGQEEFEKAYSRDDFMAIFGKNYL